MDRLRRRDTAGQAPVWLAAALLALAATGWTRGQEPTEPAAGAFDPAELAAGPAEVDAQLAQALWEAREGALDTALARLEQVLASPGLADLARPRRAIERLFAVRAARDEWLASAAQNGARLGFAHQGVRATARITGFEGGSVLLGRNRLGLDAIPADSLPVADLFRQALELPTGTPPWVRPYALLLGGEPRWDRDLRVEDEEQQAVLDADEGVSALRADADGMEALLREGHAAAELAALARLELGTDGGLRPEAAEPALERVRLLLTELGEEPLVRARREGLRAVAALALRTRFDAVDVPPGLEGAAERTASGALRIVYEFQRPEEADDFELEREALPDWHASMTPVPKTIEESYMIVRQDAFFGDGQVVYRHALEFLAPVRVSYTMRYVPRDDDPLDVGVVMIGLAWDGMGSFVGASEFGDVYATETNRGRGERVLYEGAREVGVNKLYTSEARLERGRDGLVVEAWRGGERRNELPAGGLERGGVFLFVHSPRIVAFERIEIEGVVDPASLDGLRERWVERELAGLGF